MSTYADLLDALGVVVETAELPADVLVQLDLADTMGTWSALLQVRPGLTAEQHDHVGRYVYRAIKRLHRDGPPPAGWTPGQPLTLTAADVTPPFCRPLD